MQGASAAHPQMNGTIRLVTQGSEREVTLSLYLSFSADVGKQLP